VDLAERRWGHDQRALGGDATGANPTGRGTQGAKRRVWSDGQGMPMAVVVAGADRHDRELWAATRAAVVIGRPEPAAEAPQQWWAAKADDDAECRAAAARQEYMAHSRSRGEGHQAKPSIPGYQARRWGVEVCHAWFNRFRQIVVRVEKKLATHLAWLQWACADIVLTRAAVFR
jgi:putative transposase